MSSWLCGVLLPALFSLVTLILGAVLLGVGVTALVSDFSQLDRLFGSGLYRYAAIGMTATGAAVFLIWVLGCCGAILGSTCLLVTYFVLVLVLFVVAGSGAITGHLVGSEPILVEIAAEMNKSISHYEDDDGVRKAWDLLQESFECCGVDDGADWASLLGPDQVPLSCCTKDGGGISRKCTATSHSFTKGCVEKMKDLVEGNRSWLVGMAIAVASCLLLSMIGTCVTICQ